MLFPRRLRAVLGAAAALAAVSLAPVASRAQPAGAPGPSVVVAGEPPLRMTWESDDPACSGDDVSARALRLISPGVVPRPLRASVEVRHEGEQWLVRLQTESGSQSGRRILRAESCKELEQAISLLLAMAMESKGDMLPPEPPPPVAAVPPPAPAAPERPPPAPPAVLPAPAAPREVGRDRAAEEKKASPDGEGLGGFVRLDAKAALGLKPGLGLGAGLTAGLRLGVFDLGVSAAHWPASRAEAADRPGYVSVSRQNLGLRACWNAWRAGSFAIAPCIAPELTFFRWESKQVRDPKSGTIGPLTSLSAGLDLRYSLLADSLSILVTPGVTLERVQPFELRLDPNTGPANQPPEGPPELVEIYRTERFGPRLELGVDARF